MIKLEDLTPNTAIRDFLPDSLVTVVSVQWFGSEAQELTYKAPSGKVANELLYRTDEPRLEVVAQGRPWSFDGDGAISRPVPVHSSSTLLSLCHFRHCILSTDFHWTAEVRLGRKIITSCPSRDNRIYGNYLFYDF